MEMVNVLIVKAMLCVCIAYTEEIYIYPTKQLYDINIIPTTTVHFLVSWLVSQITNCIQFVELLQQGQT